MKILLFTLFILLSNFIFSQGIINNGAHIVLNGSSSNIYIDGNANGGFDNEGAGYIKSEGNLIIEGNWINNSSTDVYTSINSIGTTIFKGIANQEIGGTKKTVFENLTVNNGSNVYLTQNVDISYNLTMTNGIFDLKDKIADLGANGDIVNETETNRITSTDASWNIGNNTGTITATRTVNNVSNYNPAHLGVVIKTNQNLGTITIVRGHEIQTGSFGGSATSGVARYYEIPGIGKLDVLNVSVDMYYWDAELNGLTESKIEGFHWVTEGSSSSWWTPLDGSVDTGNDLFTTSGNPYGNYFTSSTWYGFTWSDKFTLGSKDTPLPVELTSFSANCEDNGVNISWTTASEKNNDYFVLEKSTGMTNFVSIANINGQGTINQNTEYNFFDINKKNISYYRLSQFDYNGQQEIFNTIAVSCKDNFSDLDYKVNYSNQNIEITLPNTNNETYNIYLVDNIGRQITQKQIINNKSNKIYINNIILSNGIYNLIISSNNK
ncbi:MAG: hypothetical protein DRI94_11660, partial [Bacteroidetes bacterium]